MLAALFLYSYIGGMLWRGRSSRGRPLNAPPHPTIADMDLKPIAVMLKFVHSARASWKPLGDDWLTRIDSTQATEPIGVAG
jgi:hypothetical protein